MTEKPDLLVRLADFDRYGLTATERVELRVEAWHEISKLRDELKRASRCATSANGAPTPASKTG